MYSFKVGQRVKNIAQYETYEHPISYGETGTIRDISLEAEPPIGIEWDAYDSERHTLSHCSTYHCEDGHGWYVYPEEIEAIPPVSLDIEEII